MKSLLATVVAMAATTAGMTNCEQQSIRSDDYVLEIPRGHRIKLKLDGKTQEAAVKEFEGILKDIDPNGTTGGNGTSVNLRFRTDEGSKIVEDIGPKNNGFDLLTGTPVGPDGSMHNTQRVVAKSAKDIQRVIEMLDGSFNP